MKKILALRPIIKQIDINDVCLVVSKILKNQSLKDQFEDFLSIEKANNRFFSFLQNIHIEFRKPVEMTAFEKPYVMQFLSKISQHIFSVKDIQKGFDSETCLIFLPRFLWPESDKMTRLRKAEMDMISLRYRVGSQGLISFPYPRDIELRDEPKCDFFANSNTQNRERFFIFPYKNIQIKNGSITFGMTKKFSPIAIKSIRLNDEMRFHWKSEFQVLSNLSRPHPNVLSPIMVIESYAKVQTIMDECGFFYDKKPNSVWRDTFECMSHTRTVTPLGVKLGKHFFTEFLDATLHLHSLKIFHRDIKPENGFLSELGQIKLGDFGLATTEKRVSNRVGTFGYIHPNYDYCTHNGTLDAWSLGATLFSMVTDFTLTPISNAKFGKAGFQDAVFILGQDEVLSTIDKDVMAVVKKLTITLNTGSQFHDRLLQARTDSEAWRLGRGEVMALLLAHSRTTL